MRPYGSMHLEAEAVQVIQATLATLASADTLETIQGPQDIPDTLVPAHPATPGTVAELVQMALLVTLDILVPERLATLGTAERRLSPVTLDTQDSPGTPALESPDTLVPAHPATPGTVAQMVLLARLDTPDTLAPAHPDTLGTVAELVQMAFLVTLDILALESPGTLAPAHPATPGTAASADTLETIQEPQDIPGTVVQEFRDTAAILVPMGP